MNEKRNSTPETAQPDLFGLPPTPPPGARQAPPTPPAGGGGYLSTCGFQNFEPDTASDPRFAELKSLGLPAAWLIVAESVGVDAFLEIWRRLSSEEFSEYVRRDTGGTRMPTLRSFDSWLRYQRNRYVAALAKRGMTTEEVRRAVQRNLRESLDDRHVFKLMKKA